MVELVPIKIRFFLEALGAQKVHITASDGEKNLTTFFTNSIHNLGKFQFNFYRFSLCLTLAINGDL